MHPMHRTTILFVAAVALAAAHGNAHARLWTDATGRYTVEAEAVAFNDRSVVLQRADGELGTVSIDQLSQADRDYLASKEAAAAVGKLSEEVQTWTLQNGLQVTGRVVDYARKQVTLQRRRSRIYVNDRVFENLPEIYQQILPLVVSHIENINIRDQRGLESWLVRQRGQPRTFHIEGVVMELDNGDEYVFPFFLFTPEEMRLLEAGWDEWLAANGEEDYEQRRDAAFQLESLAAARQRDAKLQRQIAQMQLKFDAVSAGVTSLWEVTLYPARGNAGPPLWVMAQGRDSRVATANALAQHPGYVAGPVRRISNTRF